MVQFLEQLYLEQTLLMIPQGPSVSGGVKDLDKVLYRVSFAFSPSYDSSLTMSPSWAFSSKAVKRASVIVFPIMNRVTK